MPNWNEVLNEIQQQQAQSGQSALDVVRRRYLDRLFQHTNRNVIAYYSGFLSKPNIQLLDINDEDMNGFMMAVHKLKREKGLDLILHTPGGSIASTETIVSYLHQMFNNDIRVIVPQIAMSAGTMIACSAKEIILGKQSSLGPIDPQLRGIPAQGVISEFAQVLQDYKDDPSTLEIWKPIIQQYKPTFIRQCKQAIEWTEAFVSDQLQKVMFKGDSDAKEKADKVVAELTDSQTHKAHERHFHAAKCQEIGLKIRMLEDDDELQDLVLTVHHCFMHTIMNSTVFKIIENSQGVAFIRQLAAQPVAIPQQLLRKIIPPATLPPT